MSIAPFAAGSFSYDRTTANLLGLKSRLDALTTQLSTGKTAQTYAGLGAGRVTSLSAHATISALDGYVAAIGSANTRVALASQSLSQVSTLGDATRKDLLTSLQSTTAAGVVSSSAQARNRLDAAVDALNQQAAGVYIFGGRETDTEPVVSTDLMLDGDASRGLAGLRTLIAEQKAADRGVAQNGRLDQSVSGATVSLSEDASAEARANFGFTLLDAKSSNGATGITATLNKAAIQGGDPSFASLPADGTRVRVAIQRADGGQTLVDLTARAQVPAGSTDSFAIGGTPAEAATNLKAALAAAFGPDVKLASIQSADPPGAALTFPTGTTGSSLSLSVGTPAVGDTITLTLGMHDGTKTTVTLTASAEGTAANTFKIDTTGATAAQRAQNTAASLNAALAKALGTAADTELAASSASRAAQDFFAGSPSAGLAPRRIAEGGNGYAASAGTGTVIWYQGDDTSSDPRSTATVQIGANRTAAIGAQANEAPIRATLAGIAALAADSFTDATGVQDIGRFRAAGERAATLLAPKAGEAGIAGMSGEFGVAASAMADAKTQALASKTTLQDAVAGVENVSTEEVAAKLLSLQTQLQASYQVTAMLSKLTLVNYLG